MVGALFLAEVILMRSLFSVPRSTGLLLGLALTATPLSAADEPKFDKIKFDTADGVTIEGRYWANSKGKKAPTVLLLHNFEIGKGGNSNSDGWDYLAEELQKKGYAVLTFDFRGHGNSTTIADSMNFWSQPYNRTHLTKIKVGTATTLSHTNFSAAYYPYLVNDIVAARAHIDKLHDAGDLNSQNLIVIGAGEGATLGMMWMASEMKRTRILGQDGLGRLRLDVKPEGKDIVCGVLLSLSPTLAKRQVPVSTWIKEVGGKTYKTPLLFVYGDKDDKASKAALFWMQSIIPGYSRDKSKPRPKDAEAYKFTAEYPIPGADATASGARLIDKDRDTVKSLIEKYFEPLMESHKITQWEQRELTSTGYAWVSPLGRPVIAKAPGDRLPKVLPPSVVGINQP
jgi:hypothetical protein